MSLGRLTIQRHEYHRDEPIVVATNGSTKNISATGTYTLSTNCSATATLTDASGNSYALVLEFTAANGKQFHPFERQRRPRFTPAAGGRYDSPHPSCFLPAGGALSGARADCRRLHHRDSERHLFADAHGSRLNSAVVFTKTIRLSAPSLSTEPAP